MIPDATPTLPFARLNRALSRAASSRSAALVVFILIYGAMFAVIFAPQGTWMP
jgi:hypothetical protein